MKIIDSFWFNEPTILFKRYDIFFPLEGMTNIEKLNSLMRFSIYISGLLLFTRKTLNVLMIPLFFSLLTIFIYKNNYVKEDSIELTKIIQQNIEEELCQMPTEENPFMNTLITDLDPSVIKKPACKPTKKVRKKTREMFYKNLYRDVNDIYERNNSERQFFTMPNTSKMGMKHGDTIEFANALFNTGVSCKEDTSVCTSGGQTLFFDNLKSNRNTILKEDEKELEGEIIF